MINLLWIEIFIKLRKFNSFLRDKLMKRCSRAVLISTQFGDLNKLRKLRILRVIFDIIYFLSDIV